MNIFLVKYIFNRSLKKAKKSVFDNPSKNHSYAKMSFLVDFSNTVIIGQEIGYCIQSRLLLVLVFVLASAEHLVRRVVMHREGVVMPVQCSLQDIWEKKLQVA